MFEHIVIYNQLEYFDLEVRTMLELYFLDNMLFAETNFYCLVINNFAIQYFQQLSSNTFNK